MKALICIATVSMTVGCGQSASNPVTETSISPKVTRNQGGSGGSKPYLAEILKRFAASESDAPPYGLWNTVNTTTSEDGKLSFDVFFQITPNSVVMIYVCEDNEIKKYAISPTTAPLRLSMKDKDSYIFTIP